MNPEYDVIIIGSGPAGVSAAFPLIERGLKVLMLDGGSSRKKNSISDNYLDLRHTDSEQWRWMIGEDYHALKMQEAVSPKLRIPNLSYVFDSYLDKLNIKSRNFVAVGSLAPGGLSNAWGAGVSYFSSSELRSFPFPAEDILASSKYVAKRIGISGKSSDDLTDYFGVDGEASPAIELDSLHKKLFQGYGKHRNELLKQGFRVGRARVAVINEDNRSRQSCSLTGNCLWGCNRESIYSASYDLIELQKKDNFTYVSGFIVENLERYDDAWRVQGISSNGSICSYLTSTKVVLAAGTLASTKLALKALNYRSQVKMLSSPTAAFLLWVPSMFAQSRQSGFGLGQLAYTLDIGENLKAFGSTFSTNGIPISEFARHVPLRRSNSIDILSVLMSSCVVGNVFLPGHLTTASAQLLDDDVLQIDGSYPDLLSSIMKNISSNLRRSLFKIGGIMLPGSFTLGIPGGDIHYAGTLPMRENPVIGESNAFGELAGLKNLYVTDGAALPILPEKSHTLTIMANADRIGRAI
jgi:hypothetical protein